MRERYRIIECESAPGLWIIWDERDEKVIDVVNADEVAAYRPTEDITQ